MIKQSVRLAGFLVALFALVLVLKHTAAIQQERPFDTSERFELNILSTSVTKEHLIEGLNALVDQYDGVLVRVMANQDNYEEQKDIIWFGSTEPNGGNLLIEGKNVNWLESEIHGELIASRDMGTRPLYGSYSMRGSAEFKAALIAWCETNGLAIDFYKDQPLIAAFGGYLIHHGIGNAVLTAFFLLLTSFVVWYVSRAKARAIRYLGGITRARIHFDDTVSVILLVLLGCVLACIAFLIYIAVASGAAQIRLVLMPSLAAILVITAISGVFAWVFSLLVSPKAEHLSRREIPLKRFKLLGRISLVVSVILSLVIIPSTISVASAYRSLSQDYALWEAMKGSVRVSFNNTDALSTDEMMPHVEAFFEQMDEQDNLSLSMVVDQAMRLSNDEMGGYDHIIIADRAWTDALGIGHGSENKLVGISFEGLSSPLRAFLTAQFPIWTLSGEVQPEGVGFYEFEGGKFLALPPNVGYGNNTIQAENPLVILVEDPIKTLKAKGFLLPAASSGNIVFREEEVLRAALSDSPISEKVASIDSFTALAFEYAQKFRQEALYYLAACVLIFAAMGFAGLMNAQLWAGSNKKRIFTLRTAGGSYYEIIQPIWGKDILTILCTMVVGALIAYVVRHPDGYILLGTAVTLAVLYGLINYLGYLSFTRQAFFKMSSRKE